MIENIFFSLAVMLLFAKIFGPVAERFGVASLVGELGAGILMGPVLGIAIAGAFIGDFITISVIMLLFMAGLEVKFDDIKKNLYSASLLAFSGGFLSFLFGFFVGMAFFGDPIIAFAIGSVMISTSNGTLFLFLMKSGEFDSRLGKMIIATTVADDVVGILFLSVLSSYVKSQVLAVDLAFQMLLVSIGFYFLVFTAGSRIMNRLLNMAGKFLDETALFAVPVAFAFLLSYVTENIGLSIAAGAFLTGMAIANSHYSENVIAPKVSVIANGFLIPVFYVAVGTMLVLEGLNLPLIGALIVAAILGKIIGVGYMARFFGIKGQSAKLFGIIMMPRGNENIALVQIVLLMGVITFQIYTSIVFAMVATIFITPVMLKLFYK